MGAICLGKHLCLNQFIDIVRQLIETGSMRPGLWWKNGWMKKKSCTG